MKYEWVKDGRIWWLDNYHTKGEMIFSFDGGETSYNFFSDDWEKLTDEQRRIFTEENPVLVEDFKS